MSSFDNLRRIFNDGSVRQFGLKESKNFNSWDNNVFYLINESNNAHISIHRDTWEICNMIHITIYGETECSTFFFVKFYHGKVSFEDRDDFSYDIITDQPPSCNFLNSSKVKCGDNEKFLSENLLIRFRYVLQLLYDNHIKVF